jgi:hypothetical protein
VLAANKEGQGQWGMAFNRDRDEIESSKARDNGTTARRTGAWQQGGGHGNKEQVQGMVAAVYDEENQKNGLKRCQCLLSPR